ncbi:hypothetical protein [Methylocella sp.]|uniref:hypothetical protein n=1 Tax=Methylocella sp. TaxID=1978226 RepID=UPI0035AD8D56
MDLGATVTTARPDDLEEIFVLLRSGRDEKLLRRPDADYVEAIGAGLFCLAHMGERLVAVAGAFVLSAEPPAIVEMGSCYVAPCARGFGLQKLFVRARVASVAALVDPNARIMTAVSPQNLNSRASVLKAGFAPLEGDARLLTELCAYCPTRPDACSNRLCCCDFFYIPREKQLGEIAALLEEPVVTVARGNGERLRVSIEVDALKGAARERLERLVPRFSSPSPQKAAV